MRNKKLIPFEVIQKAVAGEPEAVDAVLRYYNAHIKYLSIYKGHINDDTQDSGPCHTQRHAEISGHFCLSGRQQTTKERRKRLPPTDQKGGGFEAGSQTPGRLSGKPQNPDPARHHRRPCGTPAPAWEPLTP